ncbi:MAG: hypothetical protein JJT89_02355 [Nitriliruptoraceae bacterium]|nr:hypothetical protein [Nitriliruptoraceae bacterium]
MLLFLTLTLAGLADALDRGSTGVLRSLDADVVVFNEEARLQLLRSRVPRPMMLGAAFVDGVGQVGTLALVPTSAETPNGRVRVTLVGFSATTPAEPTTLVEGRLPVDGEPGIAAVDVALRAHGVRLGDRLVLAGEREVEVVGFVEDSTFLQQPTVWVPPDVWARVQVSAFPEAGFAEQLVGAAVIRTRPSADPGEVAAAIEAEFDGVRAVPLQEAVSAIPGVDVQRRTFTVLVAMSVAVLALVVGLLFALLVTERRSRWATLRALGAPRQLLVATLLVQGVVLWMLALLGGSIGTALLSRVVPDAMPLDLRLPVVGLVGVASLVATVVGSSVALRRVARTDPAAAMSEGVR